MILGRATFTSEITLETGELSFGVLHFGDHNLHGGVRAFRGDAEYEKLISEATAAFSRADIPDVIRAFESLAASTSPRRRSMRPVLLRR